LSDVVSVSQPGCVLQSPKPGWHCGEPPTQTWFGPTGELQPPQCSGSVWKFAQEPEQTCSPAPHEIWQLVPLQTGVEPPHCVLQLPQLCALLLADSQPTLASQFKKSAVQPQTLAAQTLLSPQSVPHVPQ
jgi:hypothetical protein